jgi:hypothetical protein
MENANNYAFMPMIKSKPIIIKLVLSPHLQPHQYSIQ